MNYYQKISIIFALVFLFYGKCFAQEETNYWRTLEDVTFAQKEVEGIPMEYPTFGKIVKQAEGEIIALRGYIMPLEISGVNKFILSAYPYSNCYFCGGAGPETVIEVTARNKIYYRSKPVLIKGKLRLNGSDPHHMTYLLDDAEKLE